MRFVRTLLFVGLALSIGLNILLWMKNEKTRTQFRVGDHKITKKDYHDWLEQHYGRKTQADMITYYLVTDEAKKAGVMPSDAEVEKLVNEQIEENPQLASQVEQFPWAKKDLKQGAELKLALFNLSTKDVKVTDDQIKSFYETLGPSQFDEPARLKIRPIVYMQRKPNDPTKASEWMAKRDDYLKRARELVLSMAQRAKLQQPAPNVQEKTLPDITLVGQQLNPHVGVSRASVTLKGSDPRAKDIRDLKAGECGFLPDGDTKVLVYVERREEGKKGSLADAETRKKVEQQFKSAQQVNSQQTLRELWDKTDVQTDPEDYKKEIERILVPGRAAEKEKIASAGR